MVVNLYPFADTVRSGADEAATIEKIDIGGPSMVQWRSQERATVAIITDPNDYALVASRIENGEGFSLDERRWLAGKAFAHTAAYDATFNRVDREALAEAGVHRTAGFRRRDRSE